MGILGRKSNYKYTIYEPVWKKILKYIIKVLVTAAIVMVITYGLSRYFEKEFKILLEYVAIIFLVIGGFTFVGGRNLGVNSAYTNTHEYTKRHIELLSDTAKFVIYLILVAAILLITAVFIW